MIGSRSSRFALRANLRQRLFQSFQANTLETGYINCSNSRSAVERSSTTLRLKSDRITRSSGTLTIASSRSTEGSRHLRMSRLEPSIDRLVFRRHGADDLVPQRDLIHRCHALLAVQQERFCLFGLDAVRRAFDGSRLEIDRTACLQRHQGADREGGRYRGDEALNPILIPHPASLKIGKLNLAD